MYRLTALLIALLLAACDTNPPRIDDYRYVAYSWTGGNIDEMLAAWGEPNRGSGKAEDGHPGHARWRYFSRAGEGMSHHRYFCEMIAHYDSTGTLAEIEIIRSDHCGTLYGDRIRSLLRPGVKPPPTWQDT